MTMRIEEASRGTNAPEFPMSRTLIIWSLRLALGGIFLYAGGLKAADPELFSREVAGYQLLPELAPLVAATLPTTELLLGLLLIILPSRSAWLRGTALASAAIFFVFLIAVTQVVIRGIDTRCGCFGADSGIIDILSIIRVAAFLLASVLLLILTRMPSSTTTAVAL